MEIPILQYRNHLSRERIELKDAQYEQPTFVISRGDSGMHLVVGG